MRGPIEPKYLVGKLVFLESKYLANLVPCSPRARLERYAGTLNDCRIGCLKKRITHPHGQTLIVTAGFGRAQREAGPIEEIRPGDVVWISPAEKHWHGASPT